MCVGGTIKGYECGLARWALPPGSRLIVGREGADIEVFYFDTNLDHFHRGFIFHISCMQVLYASFNASLLSGRCEGRKCE